MAYDLELSNALNEIRKHKAKTVCIQLPDGLKPRAKEIVDFLETKTKAKILIWAGSCYGACDIPDLSKQKVDLLIQWGHSVFRK
jgi:2-(3-amino-3-carboxypropyl)histidine synthase